MGIYTGKRYWDAKPKIKTDQVGAFYGHCEPSLTVISKNWLEVAHCSVRCTTGER